MTEGHPHDTVAQRKEKVLTYLKEKKDYYQYILLAVVIWLGAALRSKVLPNLIDNTTGQPITLELDSTLFARYAREIVESGSLFATDPLRYSPLGAEISGLGTFTSYFIAYLYKIMHLFSSSVTVDYAANVYPIVATAILSIFLFLLVRRLFDWKTALLSCLFINVIPTFLFRSLGGSSDHDILGMMLIVMAFYFYTVAWQSKSFKFNALFAALAGLVTALGADTAGSYTFILLVIGGFSLVEIFLNKFESGDFYSLATYVISFTFFYMIVKKTLAVNILFTSVTSGVAYLALLVALVHFLVYQTSLINVDKYLSRFKEKVPDGVMSILLGIGVAALFALVLFGPSFFVTKIADLYHVIFKAFAYSRWALTVAENKTPFVTDWMGQMGKGYVWLFILGSVFLFYDAVKHFKKAKYLTGVYAFFIFGYIFSRYSPSSVLNGGTFISKALFYSSIIVFLGVVGYSYLNGYRKKDPEIEKIKDIDKKYAFVFLWFLLMILAAASAIRLLFEFSVITTVVASFMVVWVFHYFSNFKAPYLRWAGFVVIALILFSPFAIAGSKGLVVKYYDASLSQSMHSGPGYNGQWQNAGAWARSETPKDAVFAHWWDYGYWVQEGFDRATITDGGNFFGWWNYLMGREVLTGQTEEEGLKYLKLHEATHLLMIVDEIGKYPAYSSIGSDENYDRYSWINTFTLNKQATVEKRSETVLFFQGGFPLDEDLVLDGKVYPMNQAGIGAVKIPLRSADESGNAALGQPTALLVYQSEQRELRMRCVFINGELFEFDEYDIDSCFRVIPVFISSTEMEPAGAGLYLSSRTYHSRFGQLFLLEKDSEYFDLVYDDSESIPLSVFQGRLIGPLKVWEISYPELDISAEEKDYYLRTDYPDLELLQPR